MSPPEWKPEVGPPGIEVMGPATCRTIAEFARTTACHGQLLDAEREDLITSADELTASYAELIAILKQHPDPRLRTKALKALACAVASAFSIGSRAVRNSILDRFIEQRAADARKVKVAPSQAIDAVIGELSRPLWAQRRGRKLRKDWDIAGEVRTAVNARLAALDKPEPPLGRRAISTRIKKLRGNCTAI
jgi:hypothetical protein